MTDLNVIFSSFIIIIKFFYYCIYIIFKYLFHKYILINFHIIWLLNIKLLLLSLLFKSFDFHAEEEEAINFFFLFFFLFFFFFFFFFVLVMMKFDAVFTNRHKKIKYITSSNRHRFVCKSAPIYHHQKHRLLHRQKRSYWTFELS